MTELANADLKSRHLTTFCEQASQITDPRQNLSSKYFTLLHTATTATIASFSFFTVLNSFFTFLYPRCCRSN